MTASTNMLTIIDAAYAQGMNDRQRGSPKNNTANIKQDYNLHLSYELGWYHNHPAKDYLALASEHTSIKMAISRGHDTETQRLRLPIIEAALAESNWTCDPDTGMPTEKVEPTGDDAPRH